MTSKAPKGSDRTKVGLLFDVDNTLLDNDRVIADLKKHLQREVGPKHAQHYWDIFEQLRTRLGYADYLGALQRYRSEHPHEVGLLTVSRFLINYPFAKGLFSSSLDVIERVKQWGTVVLLTDCGVVFQPRKVDCSGLYEAVFGRVLIYVDHPNTRDFQFLISDGETFCHEEKRDLDHRIEYPERDCVFYSTMKVDVMHGVFQSDSSVRTELLMRLAPR